MSGCAGRRARVGLIVGALFLVTSSLAILVPSTAAAAQSGNVLTTGSPIAGSYIVVFKDQTASQGLIHVAADKLTRADGGHVKDYYGAVLKGYAAQMSPTQAQRVADDPSVDYVEQDSLVSVDDTQVSPPSWGLDRVDQRDLPLDGRYTYSTTASNVTVYIIDTGIRTTHDDFGGRATVGVDEVGDGQNGQDCYGHGTHVAGTVGGSEYGVAKGVKLVAVRVLGCNGTGTASAVIAGVDWVTANAVKPAVANVSIGGGFSTAVNTAVQNSIASGVTYVVAANNADQDACNFSPSSTANAITVGATTITDARAPYSNYGSCLDMFAPGSSITSDWDTSDTDTNTISGTSMASPHVAGAAALYLSLHPTASPAIVANSLLAAATRDVVSDPGPGSPNLLVYSLFANCDRIVNGSVGSLNVSAGVVCLNAARVTGGITVARGATLDLENSTVAGSISASAAAVVKICGSTTGAISVTGTSATVTIGDPTGGCTPNTIHGSLTVVGNHGGGTVSGNTISGAWLISNNHPAFTQVGNHH